jgi:hypothetical protein
MTAQRTTTPLPSPSPSQPHRIGPVWRDLVPVCPSLHFAPHSAPRTSITTTAAYASTDTYLPRTGHCQCGSSGSLTSLSFHFFSCKLLQRPKNAADLNELLKQRNTLDGRPTPAKQAQEQAVIFKPAPFGSHMQVPPTCPSSPAWRAVPSSNTRSIVRAGVHFATVCHQGA